MPNEKVLLVMEDNELDGLFLMEALRRHPWIKVKLTCDMQDLHSTPHDALVVDLGIPGVSPKQIIETAGEHDKPALIYTGRELEALPEMPRNVGVIRKQMDMTEVVDRIQQMLGPRTFAG